MNSGTHAQRIIALLSEKPGLDDDEIGSALGIEPRQTINQICRRLAASGVLRRDRGPSGKIVNSIGDAPPNPSVPPRTPPPVPERKAAARDLGGPIVPEDFAKSLLIIPCSREKRTAPMPGMTGQRSRSRYQPTSPRRTAGGAAEGQIYCAVR